MFVPLISSYPPTVMIGEAEILFDWFYLLINCNLVVAITLTIATIEIALIKKLIGVKRPCCIEARRRETTHSYYIRIVAYGVGGWPFFLTNNPNARKLSPEPLS